MGRQKEKLKKKTYRTPELQKKILDETDWIEYGYLSDSDFIRRAVDEKLEELGLLQRKNNKAS